MTLLNDDVTGVIYTAFFKKWKENIANNTIPTFASINKAKEAWEDTFYKIIKPLNTTEEKEQAEKFLYDIFYAYLQEVLPSLSLNTKDKPLPIISNLTVKFNHNTANSAHFDIEFVVQNEMQEELRDTKNNLLATGNFQTFHTVAINDFAVSPLLVIDDANFNVYYSGIDIDKWDSFTKAFKISNLFVKEELEANKEDQTTRPSSSDFTFYNTLLTTAKEDTLKPVGTNHLHLLAINNDAYRIKEK